MKADLHPSAAAALGTPDLHPSAAAALGTPVVAAYAVYAAFFISRTSFVIDGTRYFTLLDDAMVSMRFAKNLAAGHGFVYNAGGPRVEGFTNPLWTVYMALWHLAGVPGEKVSVAIQISGAVCVALTIVVAWRLAMRLAGGMMIGAALASFLVAFYLPLNNWALQGFEAAPLALIVTYSAWRVIEPGRPRRPQRAEPSQKPEPSQRDISSAVSAVSAVRAHAASFDIVPYVLLAIATLIRLDAFVPAACIVAFLLATNPHNRREHLVKGVGLIVAVTAAQTFWRLWYFGYPFPNTYYLKMVGYPESLRIGRGLLVMLAFIWRMNFLLFLAPFSLVALRRDRAIVLLLAVFSSAIAYSVYVGGDAWEWWGGSNRCVSVVMPIFFVVLATAYVEWYTRIVHEPPAGRRAWIATAVVGVGALLNLNVLRTPRSLEEFTLIARPFEVVDREKYVRIARVIPALTDPGATVAVVQAGTLPYFIDREVVDMLGKNDVRIAHEPMHVPKEMGLERYKAFFPGHMKWDFAYSIGERQPDVVVELSRHPEEALPWVRGGYGVWRTDTIELYLRNASPHINWAFAEHAGTLTPVD